MASLAIFDKTGKEVGKYDIDPTDIAPSINKQLLHDVVIMYQMSARRGTHKTKNRTETAGTTKKMYRQKGTGNARAGSRRSGIRRGGGHMKQVHPRDYAFRLPRKAVQLATRMAIASKIQDGQLVVVNELAFAAPKTKEMAALLKALQLNGSTLVATEGLDKNVYMSARNIANVSVSPLAELNALAVLSPKRMLVTKGALDALKAKCAEMKKKSEEAKAAAK